MLKIVSKLEHVIGDKVYHLMCDHDAPIEHIKESLFQFLKFVGQIEDQAKAIQAQQEESKKADESKIEELKVD